MVPKTFPFKNNEKSENLKNLYYEKNLSKNFFLIYSILGERTMPIKKKTTITPQVNLVII